ncbi:hypothetical protein DFH06DRAFT_906250, partial [Mycena polygramma]
HTVFEGEVCGAILALDIVRECPRIRRVCILIDNQAAIRVTQSVRGGQQPGRYLLDIFHRKIAALLRAKPHLSFKIVWSPGHEGVEGNEKADGEAKSAAEGSSTPLRRRIKEFDCALPRSSAALKAAYK